MNRWGRFIVAFACLFAVATPAQARPASAFAKAVITACDTTAQFAVFEGRMQRVKGASKLQMRFTLQARRRTTRCWRKIKAPGFGIWITSAPGIGRYVYDKRVEQLIAPANYRVAIEFRWRDAKGKTLGREGGLAGLQAARSAAGPACARHPGAARRQ